MMLPQGMRAISSVILMSIVLIGLSFSLSNCINQSVSQSPSDPDETLQTIDIVEGGTDYIQPIFDADYDLINSSLLFDGANYHFHTSFGEYVWLQPLYIMEFYFRNGTELIDKSRFILQENHTSTWLPLIDYDNIEVIANDTYFQIDFEIKVKKDLVAHGSHSMYFYAREIPKLCVNLTLLPKWFEIGYEHFRWIWDIVPSPDFKHWINRKTNKSVELPSDTQIDLGLHRKIGLTNKDDYNASIMWFLTITWENLGEVAIVKGGKEPTWNSRGIVVIFPLDLSDIDPTTVGTTTTASATYYSPQRCTFFAKDYYFCFYSNGSHLMFNTWYGRGGWGTPSVVRVASKGEQFSVRHFPEYDDDYVYYVWANGLTNTPINFSRGTIQIAPSIGINWGTEYIVDVAGEANYYDYPDVCSATDGTLYVGYSRRSGALPYYRWYVKTCSNNDGSGVWSGSTYSGLRTIKWHGQMITLKDAKVYTAFSDEGGRFRGKLYDGGWSAWETIAADLSDYRSWQIVNEGNYLHLAYMDSTQPNLGSKRYKRRNLTAWESPESITSASYGYGLTLAIDNTTGYLWCFWANVATIYYCQRTDSWQSDQSWITGESDLKMLSISCMYRANPEEEIGVTWTVGELSPYTVRYDILDISPVEKVWNIIETWHGKLNTRKWLSVELINGTLLTRKWNLIEILNGELTTRFWNIIGSLYGKLLTKGWYVIGTWYGIFSPAEIILHQIGLLGVAAIFFTVVYEIKKEIICCIIAAGLWIGLSLVWLLLSSTFYVVSLFFSGIGIFYIVRIALYFLGRADPNRQLGEEVGSL